MDSKINLNRNTQIQESLVIARNVNTNDPNQHALKRTCSTTSTAYSGSGNNSQYTNSKERNKKSKRSSGLSSFIKNQRKMIKQANSFQQGCYQY